MLRRHLLISCVLLAITGGCDAPQARFSLDWVYLRKMEKESKTDLTPEQRQEVAEILVSLFGTPDAPHLLPGMDSDVNELLDVNKLRMAAGPVGSDEQGRAHGLYREHCGHCHGVTGDGKGPTAEFLNPYPRDYRMGVFKFKSTPKGGRPTDEDLHRILINGVAGTAMPSFKLLSEVEIDALVEYVKYLGIRGEVERMLVEEITNELDEGELLVDAGDPADAAEFVMEDVLATVVAKWRRAETEVTPVPARPDMDEEEVFVSIQRGKELFYGAVANCVKCHGLAQLGDGQQDDFDDWAKDYHDLTGVTDPAAREEIIDELVSLGGLHPRNIIPRNLRSGVYRGGRRPVDLYWRILNGIDGSPMPAAMVKVSPDGKGLTPNDVWDLVNYVQSLPYELLSTTGEDEPVYSRLRR